MKILDRRITCRKPSKANCKPIEKAKDKCPIVLFFSIWNLTRNDVGHFFSIVSKHTTKASCCQGHIQPIYDPGVGEAKKLIA